MPTLDLYHLALTNRAHHAHTLASKSIFNKLRHKSLFERRGLAYRWQFRDIDSDKHHEDLWGTGRTMPEDEEIEVRLFNIKCDEAGTLQSARCGIKSCEE